jgi:tetratricopeptide (TPR) repeat protein
MVDMWRNLWLGSFVVCVSSALGGCAASRIDEPATGPAARERVISESAGKPEPERRPVDDSIFSPPPPPVREPPLTASASLGHYDARRDGSLRLVIEGLDADAAGEPSRALASYQRAVRLDATNPIAFLALARHHVAAGNPEEASAFLDQARGLFESEGVVGPSVDVWGVGLRAWIDRAEGRDGEADSRFDTARELSPEIWRDELLSADELR